MTAPVVTECPATSFDDLIGVACPQCNKVFPDDHEKGCGILWPMSGGRMITEKPPQDATKPNGIAVREPIPNHGPCAYCSKDVVHAYPWWTAKPGTPGSKPLHEDCKPLYEARDQVGTNFGDCAVCGKSVIYEAPKQPWYAHDPSKPSGAGNPLHDECQSKWDSQSIRITIHDKANPPSPPQAPPGTQRQPLLEKSFPEVPAGYELNAYGELTKQKSQEMQEADTSLKVIQAKSRITRALSEAVQEYGILAPDQGAFDDFGKAIAMLQNVALEGRDFARDGHLQGETRTIPVEMKRPEGPSVFIGRPYCGEVDDGPAAACYAYLHLNPDSPLRITVERQQSSALCYGFNRCWAAMFCHARFPFDYFLLQHQDIEPEGPWADILVDECEKGDFDVMTVYSPLKDDRGVTSTAYGSVEQDWEIARRVTIIEKEKMLPETATIEDFVKILGREGITGTPAMLANTGLMLIRCKEKRIQINPNAGWRMGPFSVGLPEDKRGMWPWCFPGFRMHDRINFSEGFAKAEFIPEDWDSGRWFARHGIRVGVTRRINLRHFGQAGYSNLWDKGQTHDEAFMNRLARLKEEAAKK